MAPTKIFIVQGYMGHSKAYSVDALDQLSHYYDSQDSITYSSVPSHPNAPLNVPTPLGGVHICL